MTNLSKKYGDIYRLQLGTVKTVVVSSMRLIRKVLIEQGADFGDRPNFMRYNILFSNDRGNCKSHVAPVSLAILLSCNTSTHSYCYPKHPTLVCFCSTVVIFTILWKCILFCLTLFCLDTLSFTSCFILPTYLPFPVLQQSTTKE